MLANRGRREEKRAGRGQGEEKQEDRAPMTASARRENFAKGGKGENVTSVTGERETVRGEEKQKGQKVNKDRKSVV